MVAFFHYYFENIIFMHLFDFLILLENDSKILQKTKKFLD